MEPIDITEDFHESMLQDSAGKGIVMADLIAPSPEVCIVDLCISNFCLYE